jgi:hypothetical protein
MKKIFLTILAFSVVLSAQAFDFSIWNLFKSNDSKVQQTTSKADATKATEEVISRINQLNAQMVQTDNSLQNSFLNLVTLLSSNQESNNIAAQLSAIKTDFATKEAEKSAAISELIYSYAQAFASNKANAISTIKSLTDSEKAALVDNVKKMAQNAYSYLGLASDYTKAAVSLAKNDSNITDLANRIAAVKEDASILVNNAKTIKDALAQISSLAKKGGAEI